MADPKYANLPGIAHDQPDVYETSELPEADQDYDSNYPETSDSVEVLHISANEAFGKFKGKHLDPYQVDFSDRLRPSTKKKGYVAWSGEFELTPRGEEENPLQKYQRLNCEVRELLDELEDAKKTKADDEAYTTGISKIALKVSGLQEELTKMRLEEVLGSETLRDLQDPNNANKTKLLAHLEKLRQTGKNKGSEDVSKTGTETSQDHVLYELLMKPESSKLEQKEMLAKFDKRLENLEKALGASSETMSSLSVETSQKSVMGAISVLSARTALFEPSHLDHIEGRLAALQSKMNAVAEKKQAIEDNEKEKKINELYDLVHRIQSMGNVLPAVVDRLDALQELHEQALQFSKTISQLDSVQQKLASNLSNNETLLKETQERFANNLTSIQENFKNIEQRMGNLGK